MREVECKDICSNNKEFESKNRCRKEPGNCGNSNS